MRYTFALSRHAAAAILVAVLGQLAPSAAASEYEAVHLAKVSNCDARRAEVVLTRPGDPGETVWRIECRGEGEVAVLVRCRGRQCVLLD